MRRERPREKVGLDLSTKLLPRTDYTLSDVTGAAKPNEQQVSAPGSRAVGSSNFTFSRTVYLPERVDGAHVKAKLEHGILTVEIPKATETPVTEVAVL
jgi:HSP20 family molecular chaperone IbpA